MCHTMVHDACEDIFDLDLRGIRQRIDVHDLAIPPPKSAPAPDEARVVGAREDRHARRLQRRRDMLARRVVADELVGVGNQCGDFADPTLQTQHTRTRALRIGAETPRTALRGMARPCDTIEQDSGTTQLLVAKALIEQNECVRSFQEFQQKPFLQFTPNAFARITTNAEVDDDDSPCPTSS